MFFGLIPLLGAVLGTVLLKGLGSARRSAVDLNTPNYASTSVLLSQEKERRKAQNRKGRRSTNLTGGALTGNPTLGSGSLFGL